MDGMEQCALVPKTTNLWKLSKITKRADHEEKEQFAPVHKGEKNLWITSEIKIHGIHLIEQNFTITAWINGFWIDPELVTKLNASSTPGVVIGSDEVIINHNEYLPFTNRCFHNAEDTECVSAPKLSVANQELNVVQIAFDFKANIQNKFDLSTYPFDAQLLDIQFVFRKNKFNIMGEYPEQWGLHSNYHYDRMLMVTMSESITEYEYFIPWVDFRKEFVSPYNPEMKFPPKFGLLRFPVLRYPGYYIEYIFFPLFLIVTMGICCMAMDPVDDIGDRMSFLVTLLLTTAAFQYAISESLPNSAELTVIDKYILFAYIIVCAFIIEAAIFAQLDDRNMDVIVTCTICGVWWLYSFYSTVYRLCTFKNVAWKKVEDIRFRRWYRIYSQSRFKTANENTVFI